MKLIVIICCLFVTQLNAQVRVLSISKDLTAIEAAAATNFIKYKDKNGTANISLSGAKTDLDYSLNFIFGPFATENEMQQKRNEIKNTIIAQRKDYKITESRNWKRMSYISLSKTFAGGYYSPHIYITDDKDIKANTWSFKLEFVTTEGQSKNRYINVPLNTASPFYKSFDSIRVELGKRYNRIKGKPIAGRPGEATYEALIVLKGATKAIFTKDSSSNANSYIATIKNNISQQQAFTLLTQWDKLVSACMGDTFISSERDFKLNGNLYREIVYDPVAGKNTLRISLNASKNENSNTYDVVLYMITIL